VADTAFDVRFYGLTRTRSGELAISRKHEPRGDTADGSTTIVGGPDGHGSVHSALARMDFDRGRVECDLHEPSTGGLRICHCDAGAGHGDRSSESPTDGGYVETAVECAAQRTTPRQE